MYKLILIDADRTLFDFDRAEIHSIEQALKSNNITENLEVIVPRYKIINMELWKLLEQGGIKKSILRSERFKRLFDEFNIDLDPVRFGDEYLNNLSNNGFIIEGAKELCDYLHSKYKLVILTNGIKEVQDRRLAISELTPFIDDMVVSDEAGIPKPNPAIFDYTLGKIGHYEKSEMLMIGDSLTSDILGGINYSIDTVWYNSDASPSIDGINPTYTITDLKELYSLL